MNPPVETKDIQSLVFSAHLPLREALAVGLVVCDRAPARAGLREIVEREISFGVPRSGRTRSVQLLLGAAGIRALDAGDAQTGDFSFAFKQGMISPQRSRALGDLGRNDPAGWAWQDRRVHALLLIYATSDHAARAERDRLLHLLHPGWAIVSEFPICLPADSREPFGFRDGITSAQIDTGGGRVPKAGADLLPPGEVLLGHRTAEGTVTPPPPLGVDGSFVVVRQLEQDVEGFWKFWRAQARSEAEAVWLAAKAVGRWPNGMPMRAGPQGMEPAAIEEEVSRALSFSADQAGQGCPFGAHIRRGNPRDGLGDDPELSRRVVAHHRILRRGRMYGAPAPAAWYPSLLGRPALDPTDVPKDGSRGLFFMALCADIGRQFEFIQQTWINNPKFADLYDETDPVSAGDGIPSDARRFSIPGCPVRRRVHGLQGWVTVRGGGYFLMPGKTALLRWLALPAP